MQTCVDLIHQCKIIGTGKRENEGKKQERERERESKRSKRERRREKEKDVTLDYLLQMSCYANMH